jgi:hypothetical protein
VPKPGGDFRDWPAELEELSRVEVAKLMRRYAWVTGSPCCWAPIPGREPTDEERATGWRWEHQRNGNRGYVAT